MMATPQFVLLQWTISELGSLCAFLQSSEMYIEADGGEHQSKHVCIELFYGRRIEILSFPLSLYRAFFVIVTTVSKDF